MRFLQFIVAAAALSLLAACSSVGSSAGPTAQPGSASSSPGAAATPPSAAPDPSDSPPAAASSPGPGSDAADGDVAGTIVRFTSDDAQVDVTIGEDTPAVRDFLSMLPLTLDVEEMLHLGTYDATRDDLDLLEGADVTIEIVRER